MKTSKEDSQQAKQSLLGIYGGQEHMFGSSFLHFKIISFSNWTVTFSHDAYIVSDIGLTTYNTFT
jgi:hypothetical protein